MSIAINDIWKSNGAGSQKAKIDGSGWFPMLSAKLQTLPWALGDAAGVCYRLQMHFPTAVCSDCCVIASVCLTHKIGRAMGSAEAWAGVHG